MRSPRGGSRKKTEFVKRFLVGTFFRVDFPKKKWCDLDMLEHAQMDFDIPVRDTSFLIRINQIRSRVIGEDSNWTNLVPTIPFLARSYLAFFTDYLPCVCVCASDLFFTTDKVLDSCLVRNVSSSSEAREEREGLKLECER